MVGVVRTPAEREFGKITGSHNDAARLVGVIEENLRAFARLCVFENDIGFVFVAQIFQVLRNRSIDGNFLQRDTGCTAQFMG